MQVSKEYFMELYIRQKMFNIIGQEFTIKDANEQPFFKVVPRFSIFKKKYEILDMQNNLLLKIVRRPFRFFSRHDIIDNQNNILAIIKAKFSPFKPKFKIKSKIEGDTSNYEILGNFVAWHYEIKRDQEVLAEINKRLFKLTDTYELKILDDDEMLFCIGCVIAIDSARAKQNKKSSNSGLLGLFNK